MVVTSRPGSSARSGAGAAPSGLRERWREARKRSSRSSGPVARYRVSGLVCATCPNHFATRRRRSCGTASRGSKRSCATCGRSIGSARWGPAWSSRRRSRACSGASSLPAGRSLASGASGGWGGRGPRGARRARDRAGRAGERYDLRRRGCRRASPHRLVPAPAASRAWGFTSRRRGDSCRVCRKGSSFGRCSLSSVHEAGARGRRHDLGGSIR